MPIPVPRADDFEVSSLPDRPGVLAVFKPTNSHYVFTIVTDKVERDRVGPISPVYQVHHWNTGDLGGYMSADVLEVARRLALAMADEILKGS